MATKISIDFDALTIGELEQIDEAISPYRVTNLAPDNLPIRALVGIVWFVKHKADPSVTLDSVRAMRLADFELDFAATTPDPTDAAPPAA